MDGLMANAVEIVPFQPSDLGTTSLAVTSATGNRVLASAGAASVVLTNIGPSDCFGRFGNFAVEATVPSGATAGGFPVLAGSQTTVRPDTGDTHLALICASGGTATVYISTGSGA
jgi:hypothetical protein